jgi:SAM-dependent methyltransferase
MMTNAEVLAAWCLPEVAAAQKEQADKELAMPVDDVLPFAEFLKALAPLPKDGAVIDLGCATGSYGEMMRREVPGRQYHGLDVSMPMVKETRARGLSAAGITPSEVMSGDVDAQVGDIVLCAGSLEYTKYPPAALWNLLRLNPGSWCILHRVRARIDAGGFVEEAGYCGLTVPMWRWNLAELRTLLDASGRTWTATAWEKDLRQFTYTINPL